MPPTAIHPSPAHPEPAVPGIAHLPVQMISADGLRETQDSVAVEEPLEIRLQFGPEDTRREQSLSITMRTPGHDPELASGFLYTEGIIADASSILSITRTGNVTLVALREDLPLDLAGLQRHFYTSSSCGVCGKSSIDALRHICPPPPPPTAEDKTVEASLLYSLPSLLQEKQAIFDATGGLHAAALFDRQGQLTALREDIGRHNALDKAIGYALHQGLLPLSSSILLLSGRACFELIQKAAMAGIRIVAAIGPPSSLAVELAKESGITLVGFLRERRFNIYSGDHRIRI